MADDVHPPVEALERPRDTEILRAFSLGFKSVGNSSPEGTLFKLVNGCEARGLGQSTAGRRETVMHPVRVRRSTDLWPAGLHILVPRIALYQLTL